MMANGEVDGDVSRDDDFLLADGTRLTEQRAAEAGERVIDDQVRAIRESRQHPKAS